MPSRFQNIRVYWLAFVVYWGIVLFGYDTGISGGVVSQPYFKSHFGLLNTDGSANVAKSNNISANVVSVLQAGAFFGALGSAPISAAVGRKWALFGFTLSFVLGAILQTIAGGSRGIAYIYAGRVIAGVGIGAISAVSPAYVSECAPKEVRGRITGLFQVLVAFGVMISYFVNYGVGIHIEPGPGVWRIPFGLQLIPACLLAFGLLTVKESPRWLASVGCEHEALENLASYRRLAVDSDSVRREFAEIKAAIREEQELRRGLGLRDVFLGKGNWQRFVIAVVIFMLQQWSGQNSINYYGPQIFSSIGYTSETSSLLATGVYGVVKVIATAIFVFFLVETLGRKFSLFISAIGMGISFFIVGALLKTYPPPSNSTAAPPPASKAMAAMLYVYVCFYSMGCGPAAWIYVSDIFNTRTRHYGLATASASQWLFNFILSKVTPTLVSALGYKLFLMFGAINVLGMGTFALLIPETKGRSLEEMDIIFGTVAASDREADIAKQERAYECARDTSSNRSDTNLEKV